MNKHHLIWNLDRRKGNWITEIRRKKKKLYFQWIQTAHRTQHSIYQDFKTENILNRMYAGERAFITEQKTESLIKNSNQHNWLSRFKNLPEIDTLTSINVIANQIKWFLLLFTFFPNPSAIWKLNFYRYGIAFRG